MNSVAKLLTALVVLICSFAAAAAATLQAKVIEVPSGNTLVVSNTNRSVRVRLKSVVPPEAGQPFSEAARNHLKALVLEQAVIVDYTHLADGYLDARVFLNGIDIGSQMLRDGVAWYDHNTDYELTEGDRNLYVQCEQAARAEKRGLWQDEAAVAPWEYRRIQQAKINDIVNGNASLRSRAGVGTSKTSLSNADLMGVFMGGPGSSTAMPGLRPIVDNGRFDKWTSFESPIAHFSIMIPSNGVERSGITSDPSGRPVAFDLLISVGDNEYLTLFSGKGPNDNHTDATALAKAIRDFVTGVNQQAVLHGDMISVKVVRDLKLAGYVGRQYTITGNAFSGTVRVFTRQIGEERQLFFLFALARPGRQVIGSQFLDSFKITQ